MARLAMVAMSAVLLACDGVEPPPTDEIGAYASIDPFADTNWAAIPRMATRGCQIVAIDAGDQVLKVEYPDRHVETVGRKGNGNGEYRFPRSFAVGSDASITLYDGARRRLIRFDSLGRVAADHPLKGGIWGHKPMGKIIATDSVLVDYWFADKVSDWFVSDSVLKHSHLIEEMGYDGLPTGRGWGRPTAPIDTSAHNLRWLLQEGDVEVWMDSLFVLRHATGVIEVYSLETPTDVPARQIDLKRYRRTPAPEEKGGATFENYYGERKVGDPRKLKYKALTSALAMSAEGHLMVVQLLNSQTSASMPWPAEALVVYDRVGNVEQAFALAGRSTVAAEVLEDGSLVLLGNPSDKPDATYAIQFYRVPGYFEAHSDCGWRDEGAKGKAD